MRDFEDSTLWRVSAFERARQESGTSGFARLQGDASVLPTTLVSDLDHLARDAQDNDVLEVMAACMRHQEPALPGALGGAMQRLRRESVSLRELAGWPGMSVERASRLLNALYLTGGLMITRSHPAARDEPGLLRGLFRR